MKKSLPYIIIFVVLAGLGLLIYSGARNKKKKFDSRITLREAHTSPYGMAVARELINASFTEASLVKSTTEPWFMENLDMQTDKQMLVLVSHNLFADEYDLTQFLRFVKEGNYVFIISRSFSEDVQNFFGFTSNYNPLEEFNWGSVQDSLIMKLNKPGFVTDSLFSYPGSRYEGWIEKYDGLITRVLGRNHLGQPNFIQVRAGKGSFFIHTAPLAFSNYFILHKNNTEYFRNAISVFPSDINTIIWNEYYLNRPNPRAAKKKSMLSVMMKYPPFKWGLITTMLLLALYLLMEMRRRQRMIPRYAKPVNESLDFVKTMGRLYHDRKDHGNLGRKMCNYFLEHVRSRYKIPTHTLDEDFIRVLHYKSGYPEASIREIVDSIHYLHQNERISEEQLTELHRKLELFYQNE